MRVERVCCGPDRRGPGAPPSHAARMFVYAMQSQGFTLELREDARSVLVTPGARVTDRQRLVLRALYHEIRQVLVEERPQ